MTTPRISKSLLRAYSKRRPNFGFGGVGEITYQRSYSRLDYKTGIKEKWIDTVRRVVEGAFKIQQERLIYKNRKMNSVENQKNIDRMFKSFYDMKFMPSGRGIYSMGTDLIHSKKQYAALNNCAFVSTDNLYPCITFHTSNLSLNIFKLFVFVAFIFFIFLKLTGYNT